MQQPCAAPGAWWTAARVLPPRTAAVPLLGLRYRRVWLGRYGEPCAAAVHLALRVGCVYACGCGVGRAPPNIGDACLAPSLCPLVPPATSYAIMLVCPPAANTLLPGGRVRHWEVSCW
jgi:hypothetical protein